MENPILGIHHPWTVRRQPDIKNHADYFLARCMGTAGVSGDRDDFLSHFAHLQEIDTYRQSHGGSVGGYKGIHYAPYGIMDFDNPGGDELGVDALKQCNVMLVHLLDDLKIPETDILPFYSGRRGMHLYLNMVITGAKPSSNFNFCLKVMFQRLAADAGVTFDEEIFDQLRPIRSPNAKHAKSGHYKTYQTIDGCLKGSMSEIREKSKQPFFFTPSQPSGIVIPKLAEIWADCEASVASNKSNHRRLMSTNNIAAREGDGHPFLDNFKIYHETRDFLLNGATENTRHTRLDKAARNFADFGSGAKGLAYALLFPAAFLSDLPESEIIRVIEDAFKERG